MLKLSRRMLFIGSFGIIGICMLGIGLFVDIGNGNLCLVFIVIANFVFQGSVGSAIWVYASEVLEDAALGICIFLMFGGITAQSLTFIFILKGFGVDKTFYLFGAFQIISIVILLLKMKETKGLS